MKTMILGAALLAAAGVFATAQQDRSSGNEGTEASDMGPAKLPPMTDANISATIKTHNDVEIKESKLAVTRAVSPDVKSFAKQMVRDHDKNNDELQAVERRTGIRAKAGENVATRENKHIHDYQQLSSHRNAAFDSLYLDHVISQHQDALKKIDQAVSENVGRDPALRDMIQRTRDTEKGHLEQAQQLKDQLGAGSRGEAE